MNAYSVIAKIYDKANTDFDYKSYFEFVKHYLTGKVVELACGSGAFTSFLLKSADSIIAVDSSKEMLDIAVENNFKNRQYVNFVCNDLKEFAPPSKVNAVVAVCDGFNYVRQNEITAVFEKISGYLRTGGYFVFDISSENKLINMIGNNVFFEDNDDFTYLWANKLFEDRVEMDITMFVPCGQLFAREDESHIQYIHKKQVLEQALEQCGFEVKVFDGEKFDKVTSDSMRLLFVCKKV